MLDLGSNPDCLYLPIRSVNIIKAQRNNLFAVNKNLIGATKSILFLNVDEEVAVPNFLEASQGSPDPQRTPENSAVNICRGSYLNFSRPSTDWAKGIKTRFSYLVIATSGAVGLCGRYNRYGTAIKLTNPLVI